MQRVTMWFLLLCSCLPLVMASSEITSLRTIPSRTSTATQYHAYDISNLTSYFTYADTSFGVLQDWYGNLYYNGAINKTFPKKAYRYTYDHDALSYVSEVAVHDDWENLTRYDFWNWAKGGYWGFEEYNGTHYVDWGPNDLGAKPQGTTRNYSGCKIGACVEFDGVDDYLNITTDDNDIDISRGNFTVLFWVKATYEDGGGVFQHGDSWYNDGVGFGLAYLASPQELGIYISNGTAALTDDFGVGNMTAWTMLGIKRQGNNFYKIYNGVTTLIGTMSGSITNSGDTVPIAMGRRFGSGTHTKMTADEVLFANYAMTPGEVLARYTQECLAGYCYYFNGINNRMNITSTTYNLQNVTIGFSAKLARSGANNQIILGSSGTNNYRKLYFSNADQLLIESNTNNDYAFSTAGLDVSDTMHTYVVTCENMYCTFYQDGVNITEDSLITNNVTYDLVGSTESSQFLNGTLDDLFMLNFSIDSDTVARLYAEPLYVVSPNNGTYYTTMEYTASNMSRESYTGTSTYVYDSILRLFLKSDLNTTIPSWYVDVTNTNTSSVWTYYGNTTPIRINASYGNYQFDFYNNTANYTNLTGQTYPLVIPGANLTYYLSALTTLWLVDEITGEGFDMSLVNLSRVWFDDNITYYDFKSTGTNNVVFVRNQTTKLTVEYGFDDGTIITRYVDVPLLNNTNTIFVCANPDTRTHYEQLLVSSTNLKSVVIRNDFSKCYVAADYTRFAYENAWLLRAFTIDQPYDFYTYDADGDQVLLINIDGGKAVAINLDTLEFTRRGYNLNIYGDALVIDKTGSTTFTIAYENIYNDNTAATFTVTRTDTDAVIYTETDFTDPNDFVVVFDYSTVTNLSNSTVFKMEVARTYTDYTGQSTTENIYRYTTQDGKQGVLDSKFALIMSFTLVLFGMTLVLTRTFFSFLGIVLGIGAIAITALSVAAWYITVAQAVLLIITVYIFIVTITKYYPGVS